MIVKEATRKSGRDRQQIAGIEAERQMAFYLKRRFGDDESILVFNDLRIERKGEIGQIDHLVIHKHGLIIIESKSVSGQISVNEHGEFTRVFGNRPRGMESPIEQAKRQGDLLRKLLIDHKEELRNKYFLGRIQGGFKHCPIEVLVAISDKAIIHRASTGFTELKKAERIPEEVQRIADLHRNAAKIISLKVSEVSGYVFAVDELKRIAGFLCERHIPSEHLQAKTSLPVSAVQEEVKYRCKMCQSKRLEIRYGRSYYFKCLECDGNTPIRNICGNCGSPTRTNKRGLVFFSCARRVAGRNFSFQIVRRRHPSGHETRRQTRHSRAGRRLAPGERAFSGRANGASLSIAALTI